MNQYIVCTLNLPGRVQLRLTSCDGESIHAWMYFWRTIHLRNQKHRHRSSLMMATVNAPDLAVEWDNVFDAYHDLRVGDVRVAAQKSQLRRADAFIARCRQRREMA